MSRPQTDGSSQERAVEMLAGGDGGKGSPLDEKRVRVSPGPLSCAYVARHCRVTGNIAVKTGPHRDRAGTLFFSFQTTVCFLSRCRGTPPTERQHM